MPNQYFGPEGDVENYFISEYWLIDQWVGDTLLTWGYNGVAQLGDNTTTSRFTPVTTLVGGTNWKQSSGGGQHTAAIKTDGTLWIWGRNNVVQLGDNTTTNKCTPVTTFAGGTNWKQVSCGGNHTAAIKTDGTLWTWGFNSSGQIGDNTFTNRSTPITTFAGGTNWKQVSSGSLHTIAIKTDGTLWVWGDNFYGNLGDNTATARNTPVTTFAGGNNWKQVSASAGNHFAAIKTDGTLWTWGRNNFGQIGDNTTNNRCTPVTTFAGGTNWKQVSCGYAITSAIKINGTLWTWGRNGYSQLGINLSGASTGRTTPVTTFAGGTNWKQVSCSYRHISAIKTDGTLWSWGQNSLGQLGDNIGIDRSTPVTTLTGGSNWKQVACGSDCVIAVTSGTDPTFFVS